MKKSVMLGVSLLALTACSDHEGWSDVNEVPPSPDADVLPPLPGLYDAGPFDDGGTKKYQLFCDAAIPLIESNCRWNIRCGFIDQRGYDSCVRTFLTVVAWRCGTQLTHPDSDYDRCFSDFETHECVFNTLPDSCVGIW